MKLLAPIGAGIAIAVILIVIFTSGIMVRTDTDSAKIISNKTKIVSNSPPIANNQSVTTTMDTPLDIMLTSNDVDVKDNLTGIIVTPSFHGTLSPINQDTDIITYTPDTGFTGNDNFTFIANNGKQIVQRLEL